MQTSDAITFNTASNEWLTYIYIIVVMMAGSMMLKHFGMFEESETLEEAIASACRRGYMPPDLGGQSSRTEFVDQVLSFCRK